MLRVVLLFLTATLLSISQVHASPSKSVSYGYETVDGVKVFFRQAGDPTKPTLVLLHGFPSSSHQYRELIRLLSDEYYLIAPDYPGFGASDFPGPNEYEYTFDNIALTVNKFLEQREISKYSLLVHDYGAPVGFRIATANPERVQSIIVQNGNAYEEGLNKDTWAPIMKLWEIGRGDAEHEAQIAAAIFSREGLRWQYTHGTRNPEQILPDNWILDHERLSRPGQHEVQISLFYDYRTNVAKYPEWQAYMRRHQPPVLVVWAENDAFFPTPGGEAFMRDVKDVDFNLLNSGHFALEEDAPLVAEKIRSFLRKRDIE
ncbi:MAG: alpha/beta hydrolase [Kordiimonadaceae bacterium]|nr:alpha/beta hydrolase [Kordiimonadaceae bacterium]MBO6567532.1 alpha/beta hydrolase [Kordiimonadaceae bacterium]MBO6963254.1 alpha/beta hydrolase [Kordiimonadaceae bacterium]